MHRHDERSVGMPIHEMERYVSRSVGRIICRQGTRNSVPRLLCRRLAKSNRALTGQLGKESEHLLLN